MKSFKFDMGKLVRLELTSEEGRVIARAEYEACENNYLVRYVAADGRQVENWFNESALATI